MSLAKQANAATQNKRRRVQIDEVNLAQNVVTGIDRYGLTFQITYGPYFDGGVVAVPRQGENWIIEQYRQEWRLKYKVEDLTQYLDLAPGDKLINAGTLWVGNNANLTNGFLTINDPIDPQHSATKNYVDNQIAHLPTPGIISIFGRTGIVTAQTGDYNSGQITTTPTSISSNYTALTTDQLIEVSCSTAQINLTLPLTSTFGIGKILRIQKVDSTLYSVRIGTTSNQYLGGYSTATGLIRLYLGLPSANITLLAESGGWRILETLKNHLDVRDFGAVGDGTNDDSTAINNAIVAGKTLGIPVYIPAARAGNPSSGVRGYYLCNSPLYFYGGSVIYGDGGTSTEIRFLNNTHGLQQQSFSTFTTGWKIKGMLIRGNADLDTSNNWTVGLYIGTAQDFDIDDVQIDRFVDGIVSDATLATARANFKNLRVYASGYPNFTNRYPRYLFHLMSDGTTKTQVFLADGVTLYGNGTAKTFSDNGTSASITCSLGVSLWAESGIKVYVYNSSTQQWVRKVSGVDYNLYAGSLSGSIITPNSINVSGLRNSSPVTTVVVDWIGSPPGSTVNVEYNDPTARKGLYIEYGNANDFKGAFGGAETCIQLSDTGVFYTTFGTANADLRFSTSYNQGTVSIAYVAGAPSTSTTTSTASLSSGNYTVTITLATNSGGSIIATANDVINAIRSDPTSYYLLDVRGVTNTTTGIRSNNTGVVSALSASLLSSSNVQTSQNRINAEYIQIANTGIKLGKGAGQSICSIGTYPSSDVVQIISRDAPSSAGGGQSLKTTTTYGDGREWFYTEKISNQIISSGSFTTVTWDNLPDSHSTSNYLYYDSEFGFGGREIEFEGDIEVTSSTGSFDGQIQLQQSLDRGTTWTPLKTVEIKDLVGIPTYTLNNWTYGTNTLRTLDRNSYTTQNIFDAFCTLVYDLENNQNLTRRRSIIFAYEDHSIYTNNITGQIILYRIQAKVNTGTNITFCGITDDSAYTSQIRLKVRDVNLSF